MKSGLVELEKWIVGVTEEVNRVFLFCWQAFTAEIGICVTESVSFLNTVCRNLMARAKLY